MKRIILCLLIPLIIAIASLFCFSPQINSFFFHNEITIPINSNFHYIENFRNNQFYEDQFLSSNDSSETIFILGSSELTNNTEAIPYNFISDRFKTKVIGIGHAGNQCFSIYSQLLANENRLENAPIVIILSPGWFNSGSSHGTPTSSFLEFNSPRFLYSILQNDSSYFFKQYEIERISKYLAEITTHDLCFKTFSLEIESMKSIFHKIFYYPIIKANITLFAFEQKLLQKNKTIGHRYAFERKSITPEEILINWDSLFTVSKQEHINNSSNNKWYIDNNYYNQYINGKTSSVSVVKDSENQELKDFMMLVKLLQTRKANASFIILPLNPYYYSNSNELSPLINSLQAEITKNNFPCLNFWNADSTTFDKGILKDVMHLDKYGWYQVNKFIVETYKLKK